MSNLEKMCNVLVESKKCLDNFFDEILKNEDTIKNIENDEEYKYLYTQCENIRNLSEDCLLLISNKRYFSLPLIIRPMMEGLFKISASLKTNKTIEILLYEYEYDKEKLIKWKSTDINYAINKYDSEIKRLQTKYNITKNVQWDAFTCAHHLDNTDGMYRGVYGILCGYVHSTFASLTHQRNNIEVNFLLQQLSFIIISTISLSSPTFKIENNQKYFEKSILLLQQLLNNEL